MEGVREERPPGGTGCPLPAAPHPRRSAPQIIEKRRRDRINNSLSELRRLVPSAFEKQVGGSRPGPGLPSPSRSGKGSGVPGPAWKVSRSPFPPRDRPSWRRRRSCR